MPTVELVFDADCPNVSQARAHLREAFERVGVAPRWSEYLREAAPPHARAYGSPAILIDGRDVSGAAPGDARCRLYEGETGALTGAPSVDRIAAALVDAGLAPAR